MTPLVVRDTPKTQALVKHLFANGILATGLSYPVVPKGDEEIRFQVSADHTSKDIETVLAPGEVITLMGRNGMGKTTTANSVTGLCKPQAGEILFEGERIDGLAPHQMRRFVMQLHGQGLAAGSLARTLSAWRAYYRWLAKRSAIARNPCDGLRAPKRRLAANMRAP